MDFTAVAIFAVLAFALPGTMLVAQAILGPKVRSNLKDRPFETGHDPFAVARGHIPVKFYQVAMLFIIFDLEIVFLWPWAVVLRRLAAEHGLLGGLLPMAVFLGLLTLSYVYAWRKGVLRWES
ncbi:MAG: NADH-quinone oxidoreductase subunit A [Candidatus Sumerlaeia bacterium]|nr:NADH-quinone oxidoreductase subunit A [Candidatus Sumerlaeia bacterium]